MSYEVENDKSALPESQFTIVENALIRDGRLKRMSRLLMIEIMSHSEKFVVTEASLVRAGREGRDAIRNALHELEEFGYLRRVPIREAGKFGGVRYVPIRDPKPSPENPSTADNHRLKTSAGKPVPENPTLKKTKEEHQKEDDAPPASEHPPTFSDDVVSLCDKLADWIGRNTGKRPRVPQAWLLACRRMIEIDELDPKHIAGAIDWCQQDEFWAGNILSMPKLREKYPTLLLQAKRKKPGRPTGAEIVAATNDQVARFEAMEAQQGLLQIGGAL